MGPGALKNLHVPFETGVSVSSSPVVVLQSNPIGLQNRTLWWLLFPLLDAGLRTFPPVGELLWSGYFPVCGSHTLWVWDWFYPVVPSLLLHCGFSFVFVWRVSFLVGSSIYPSMVIQQLVLILVLSQERVSTCPSTLSSWANLGYKVLHTVTHFNIKLAWKYLS